ncbi:hypothetical protein FG379_000990 [Cryptosporidium bovis]|uniref:uncharacterized protein n=1 Tax=Cryptosporidium bovis TaxID=310047 RepID=UPI00351AA951|nr:hypothetical protein FG379_000990 [Cryptosporidium bovis]
MLNRLYMAEKALSIIRSGYSIACPEPQSNVKSQWDFLLQEMTWLSKDYYEERRWKMYAAKRLSLMVQNYWRKRMLNLERHVSSKCSALIQSFWLGIVYNIDKELVPSDLEPYTMTINQMNNGEDIQISPARKRLYNYCTRQMEQSIFECNKINEILASIEKEKDKMKDIDTNKNASNTVGSEVIPSSPLSIDIDQDNESCQWVIDEDLLLQLDPLVFSKAFVTSSTKETTSDVGNKLNIAEANSLSNNTNQSNNTKAESKNKSNMGLATNNNFTINSNDISDLFKEFSTKKENIGDSDDYQKSLENWADIVHVLLQGPGIINTISEYRPPDPYIDSKNLIIAPKKSIMDIEDISLLLSLFVLSVDSLPAFVNRYVTSSPSNMVYRTSSGMMSGSSHDSIGNDFGPESKRKNRRRAASSSKKILNTITQQAPTSTSVVPHMTTGSVVAHNDQNVYDILAYADTWDLSEDVLLVYFVSKYTSFDSACIINTKHPPTTNWNLIALSHNYFFSTLYGRMKTAKQCQERWNYLYKGDENNSEKNHSNNEGNAIVSNGGNINNNRKVGNINSTSDRNVSKVINEDNHENDETFESNGDNSNNVGSRDINTNINNLNSANDDTNDNSNTTKSTNTNFQGDKKDKPKISRSDIDKVLKVRKRVNYINNENKYYNFSASLFDHIKEFALDLKRGSRYTESNTEKDVEMKQVEGCGSSKGDKKYSTKSSSIAISENEMTIKSGTAADTNDVSNADNGYVRVKPSSSADILINQKQFKPSKLIPQLSLSDIINSFKNNGKSGDRELSPRNINNVNGCMGRNNSGGNDVSKSDRNYDNVSNDNKNSITGSVNNKDDKAKDDENGKKEDSDCGINLEIPFGVVNSYKREQLHILSSIVSKFGANMKKRSLQNQQFQDSFQITSYIQTIKQNYGPNILQDGVLPPHQSHANLVAHVNQMLNQHIESTMVSSKNNSNNSNNGSNNNSANSNINNGSYGTNNGRDSNNINNNISTGNSNNSINSIGGENNSYNGIMNSSSSSSNNINNDNSNNTTGNLNNGFMGANDNLMASKGDVTTGVNGNNINNTNKSIVNNNINTITNNRDNINNSNSVINNNAVPQQIFSSSTVIGNKNSINSSLPSTQKIGSNNGSDNKNVCHSGSIINSDVGNSNMNVGNDNSGNINGNNTISMSHPQNQTPLPSGIPAHLLAPGNLPPATTVEEYLSRLPGIDIQLKLIDYTLERYKQSTMGGRYGGTGMLISTSTTCRKPQLPEFLLQRSVINNGNNSNTSVNQQQNQQGQQQNQQGQQNQHQHSVMIKNQNQGSGGNGGMGVGMGVVNNGSIGMQGGLIIGHGENQQMSYTPPMTGGGGNSNRHGQVTIQNSQVVNKAVKKREVNQKPVSSQNSSVKRRKSNVVMRNSSNSGGNNNSVPSNMGVGMNMQANQLQQKQMQNQQFSNTQNQQQYQHKLQQQQGGQYMTSANHHHQEGLRQMQFQQPTKQGQVIYQQLKPHNLHPQSPSQQSHVLGNIGNLTSHNLQGKGQQYQQNQSINSNNSVQYGVGGAIQQPHLVGGGIQSRIQGEMIVNGGASNNSNNANSGNITGSHHHPGINASSSTNISTNSGNIGVNVNGVNTNTNIVGNNIANSNGSNSNIMNSTNHNIVTQGMNNEGIFMQQMTNNGNIMKKSGDIVNMNTTGSNVNLMGSSHTSVGNNMNNNIGVVGIGRGVGGIVGVGRGGLGGTMGSNDTNISNSSGSSQSHANRYQSSSQSSIFGMNGGNSVVYKNDSLNIETWNSSNNGVSNGSSDIGLCNQSMTVNVGDSSIKMNNQCYNAVPSNSNSSMNTMNYSGIKNGVNINNTGGLVMEAGHGNNIINSGRLGMVAGGGGPNINNKDTNLNGIVGINKNGNIAE